MLQTHIELETTRKYIGHYKTFALYLMNATVFIFHLRHAVRDTEF